MFECLPLSFIFYDDKTVSLPMIVLLKTLVIY
jgi:hypothetical protein